MALSEKAISIMTYLRNHGASIVVDNEVATLSGEPLTANDIAEALDINFRSVNGTVTSLVKKGYAERIVVEGVEKKVIILTDLGRTVDLNVEAE